MKEKQTRMSLTVSLMLAHIQIHTDREQNTPHCVLPLYFSLSFYSLSVSCAKKVPFSSLLSHLTSPLSFLFTLRSVSGEENGNGWGRDNKVLGVWRE